MKLKTLLVIFPLLGAAGVAMAQSEGVDKQAPASPAQAAAPAPGPSPVQAQTKAKARHSRHKAAHRQGRDVRRCLDAKTNAAVIRCADPGRKKS
ncbi:MAG: hypothetical protein M0Z73_08225 [Betaproteobacteria bacterium]|nr:hypothetical protein [Betaproteobacteria bacterium]